MRSHPSISLHHPPTPIHSWQDEAQTQMPISLPSRQQMEAGRVGETLLPGSRMPLKETLFHTFISRDDFYGPSVSWLLSIVHEDSGGSSGIFSQLESCPRRGGGRGRQGEGGSNLYCIQSSNPGHEGLVEPPSPERSSQLSSLCRFGGCFFVLFCFPFFFSFLFLFFFGAFGRESLRCQFLT